MSTMNLDKPLDEIIATKKKSRPSKPRGAPRAPRAANAATAPTQQQAAGARGPRAQQHAAAAAHNSPGASATAGIQGIGDKIVISNLPTDVNEQQVRELFTSTVGPIISASMAYDAHGRSKGTATIHFRKAADATKAFQQYNKRLIDNSRPLKVEIIVDPNRVPPQPLTSRLGAAPAAPPKARVASSTVAAASGASGAARQQTRATGGRGRGRGGRSGERRAKPTVESLDAEMSDYLAQASNVAAAPAA